MSVQAEVNRSVRFLANALAGVGKSGVSKTVHTYFWSRVAYKLFEQISHAFVVKANGGTDDLGKSWPDLDQHTKAYHRDPRRGDLSRQESRSNRNSAVLGLLTQEQDKEWRKTFGSVYARNRGRLGDAEAMAKAGAVAWTVAKSKGARTKLDVLGNRDLEIISLSGKIFKSLLPGRETAKNYRKRNTNQIFKVTKTGIEIGTKVPYAAAQHELRPLWPDDIDPWIDNALEYAIEETVDFIDRYKLLRPRR